MASIKQIVNFQLKVLRMAGFVEYVQQVAKLFKDFRDSGEEGVSQLPNKVEPVYASFKDRVTAVDDALVADIMDRLRATDRDNAKLGLRAYVLPVEDAL